MCAFSVTPKQCRSVGRPGGPSVGQSVGRSVCQSVSQLVGQSVNQFVGSGTVCFLSPSRGDSVCGFAQALRAAAMGSASLCYPVLHAATPC